MRPGNPPRLDGASRPPRARVPLVVGWILAASVAAAGCLPLPGPPVGEGRGRGHGSLPALHAEPDPASGGRIVDSAGREVLLRGVNVNALVEYWQYGDFPTTFPLTGADAEMIAGTGWNAVRLLVSWSRVEPEAGRYDEQYLDEVAGAVELLAEEDLYSIIDFHQDAWGPTLAAAPDQTCPPGSTPAFGWDGAPGWATQDGGAARCVPAGIRELSPAVRAAFTAFWNDAPGPGGVGIRSRYAAMVGHVAGRFAGEAAVAGYDVMNEPNAFSAAEIESLGQLYGDTVERIRAAEERAGGFPHLVLVEPSVTWSDLEVGTPPPFTDDPNIVFAPHIYRGGLSPGPIPRQDFERARSDAASLGGAPVLVGEWGADPRRASDPGDVYFRRHQDLQDEFRFSSTLWTWRESCGDPHKAGAARAGRVPFVWGAFDVDCRTNTVLGPREALLDQLRRAHVRAAPGRLVRADHDPSTGHLEAVGAGARPGTELVVWHPDRHPDRGTIRSEGLRGLRLRPAPAGGSLVVARATGGEWSLELGNDELARVATSTS